MGLFLDVGASACVTCTVGQYSADVTGGADCSDCSPGSQTENAASVGLFLEVGASACVVCTIGQYSAHATGGVDCIDCIAGEYAGTGAVACTDCIAGKFDHDGSAQTECEACGEGTEALTFLPVVAFSQITDCTDGVDGCRTIEAIVEDNPAGTDTGCQDCGAGNFQCPTSVPSLDCGSWCEATAGCNYFLVVETGASAGRCCRTTLAPAGAVADTNAGANFYIMSPRVTTGAGLTACTTCTTGTVDLDGEANTACSACVAGRYAETSGLTACSQCLAGNGVP